MAIPKDHKPYLDRKDFAVDPSIALTAEERKQLARYGNWLEALANGAIRPSTPAQERFLLVVSEKVKPESVFEQAWTKVKRERARKLEAEEKKRESARKLEAEKKKRESARKLEAEKKKREAESSSIIAENLKTALSVLRGLLSRGQVLSSLADSLLRQAEEGKKLSPKQIAAVYSLIRRAGDRQRDQSPRVFTGQSRKHGSHRWSHPGS